MTLAPFTAHIKIIPHRGQQTSNNFVRRGGRFDYWRDMQKLAILIYEQLEQDNARLREALQSIAANTCCEPCQEAKRVAQATLQENK